MENGFENRNNIIKPESVADIELREVREGEPGYENAMIIDSRFEGDLDKSLESARELLEWRNWWLQDEWRNKDLKEQVVVRFGDSEFSIYNYGEALSPGQIKSFEEVTRDFSSIKNGEVLKKITTILIKDQQPKNPNTGGDANGYGVGLDKALQLFPNALRPVEHRVAGVPNLDATLIHEFSHSVGNDIESEWAEKFGWSKGDEPRKLPGGSVSRYLVAEPQRCVTEYATINPAEDICESMVAALRNPALLDPARLEFIRSRLLDSEANIQEVHSEIRDATQVYFPKIVQPVLYKYHKREPIRWKNLAT